MRFQHGVEDNPTRWPISATESDASTCSTARILRSMTSIAAGSGAVRTGADDANRTFVDDFYCGRHLGWKEIEEIFSKTTENGSKKPFGQRTASSASTSWRRGAPVAPPNLVHFNPAAAAAKRIASTTPRFSASASVKAPWKTSPAASVSIAAILNTGITRIAPSSRHSTGKAPFVAARKASVNCD